MSDHKKVEKMLTQANARTISNMIPVSKFTLEVRDTEGDLKATATGAWRVKIGNRKKNFESAAEQDRVMWKFMKEDLSNPEVEPDTDWILIQAGTPAVRWKILSSDLTSAETCWHCDCVKVRGRS